MSAVSEYHTNVYERITDMLSLLYEADGISVHELASKYRLSPEIILEDLKYMLESEELALFLFPCEEALDTEEFLEELLMGKHNDVKLYAERTDDDYLFSLQLSSFEKIFLNAFLQTHDPGTRFYDTDAVLIKQEPSGGSRELLRTALQFHEALREHLELMIDYRTDAGTKTLRLVPAGMVRMVSDGSSYCQAWCGGEFVSIRLDRVERIRSVSGDRRVPPKDRLQEEQKRFAYRWGMRDDEGPFSFAMLVYDEANLPVRLYRELKNRVSGRWTRREEGVWLYEDTVIDYQSLKQWVLELGSSVRVLEPKRMAEEIRREAYERLALYGEGAQMRPLPSS